MNGHSVTNLLRLASEKVKHRLERFVLQKLQIVPAALLQPCHKGGVPLLQAVLHIPEQQPATAFLVGRNHCQWLLFKELQLAVWQQSYEEDLLQSINGLHAQNTD